MKKEAILFVFLCLIFTSVSAQNDDGKTETLFNGKVRISGFGAPLCSWGSINGQFASLSGGGGAVTFNRRLFIGGYNLSTDNRIKIEHDLGGDSRLRMEHGGFWVGYDFMPKKLIHPTVSVKTGWGTATLAYNDNDNSEYVRDAIFVVEPEVGAELNVAKFFKIALSGSYRFVQSDDELAQYDVNNLDGFTMNASLKFGWFN